MTETWQRAKSGEQRWKVFFAVCTLLFAFLVPVSHAEDVIKTGSIVTFEYTLTVNGQVIETSEGKNPIKYMQGQGTIVPGLEKALEGMKAGEEKTITVPAAEAYGPIQKDAIKDVPKENFPADFEFVLGSLIQLEDPDGNAYPGIIWDVKEKTVSVNFNHPLAGQTLLFDVKILSIE